MWACCLLVSGTGPTAEWAADGPAISSSCSSMRRAPYHYESCSRLPTVPYPVNPPAPVAIPQRPGRRPPPHDLECAHVLLAGAGAKLDGSTEDNRRAVDAYCRVLDSLLAQGGLLCSRCGRGCWTQTGGGCSLT